MDAMASLQVEQPENALTIAPASTSPSFEGFVVAKFSAPVSSIAAPEQSSPAKSNAPNTVLAADCAAFSSRPEVSASASSSPFGPGETGQGAFGDDDGIRVRIAFTVNLQVFGTFVNSVYHPAGTCNGRRCFRRSIAGGGAPPLFLYFVPEQDSWVVGLKLGDTNVYAYCSPASDHSLSLPWQVWDGYKWVQNPPSVVTVQYCSDQQTARWEDQEVAFKNVTKTREAHRDLSQKLYKYALRGGLSPLMEKGGILQELAVLISTDKIPGTRTFALRKVAWDVRVINSSDGDRYGANETSALAVVDACRTWCINHHDTAKRCAEERSWYYEPLVFTMQGDFQKEVETAISLLARAIAERESQDGERVMGEIRRGINACLGIKS